MANLSDIPDEAVEAAHDVSYGGEHANRHHIRMMLAAALPVLNTARDPETEAMRAELEQHRSGESYEIGESYGRATERADLAALIERYANTLVVSARMDDLIGTAEAAARNPIKSSLLELAASLRGEQ